MPHDPAAKRPEMPDRTTIDELDQPALIIHWGAPVPEIMAANLRGRQLWGLTDATTLPVALSPDMPALAALTVQPRTAQPLELVFWTRKGAQRLRCALQPLPDPAAVLVIFEAEVSLPDEPGTPQSAQSSRSATTVSHGTASMSTASVATSGPDGVNSPSSRAPPAIDLRTMAHELRTPLGAIVALAEMIEREQLGPVGDQRYRDYARDIGESAKLTLSIVVGALEAAQSIEGILRVGFAELDLAELVGRCLRTVSQAASAAGISLENEVAANIPLVIANRPGLTQIVINLLTNAVKFTAPGGTVTVAISHMEGGGLALTIADTGVGMTDLEANLLVAIPDASSTCDPAAAPSGGIGFSLVRRLARAMSADLDVTSKRGVGTRVTLTFASAMLLPVAEPPA